MQEKPGFPSLCDTGRKLSQTPGLLGGGYRYRTPKYPLIVLYDATIVQRFGRPTCRGLEGRRTR